MIDVRFLLHRGCFASPRGLESLTTSPTGVYCLRATHGDCRIEPWTWLSSWVNTTVTCSLSHNLSPFRKRWSLIQHSSKRYPIFSKISAAVSMPRDRDWSKRIDVILVILSVVILSTALWIWVTAMPVAKETVFLATTIALVISLVLIVNVAILVVLRLQKRVSHLEELVASNATKETPHERVVVVTLTNTERRIINRLEENGGEMAQDELRRVTGLSKSTLSVTLSALERKSIVSRAESGRTKIVVLEQKVTR